MRAAQFDGQIVLGEAVSLVVVYCVYVLVVIFGRILRKQYRSAMARRRAATFKAEAAPYDENRTPVVPRSSRPRLLPCPLKPCPPVVFAHCRRAHCGQRSRDAAGERERCCRTDRARRVERTADATLEHARPDPHSRARAASTVRDGARDHLRQRAVDAARERAAGIVPDCAGAPVDHPIVRQHKLAEPQGGR